MTLKAVARALLLALVLGIAFLLGMQDVTGRGPVSTWLAERNDPRPLYTPGDDETDPTPYLQPARHDGSGVTRNTEADDGALILLSGYIERANRLRLIRRDGTVVADWEGNFARIFGDREFLPWPRSWRWFPDLHGALANPDGSVVFNFHFGGSAKLDRCGTPLWVLRHPTHHSVERAERGGYWIPGQRLLDPPPTDLFPPFTHVWTSAPLLETLILHVREDGSISTEISVPRVLFDSGLAPVLTATGEPIRRENSLPDGEIVHLNKVAELGSGQAALFPGFAPGDLLVAFRKFNMVAVIDPVTLRVKWHQTGPWVRMHDPEFAPDGTISVFNNNAYRIGLDRGDIADPAAPRTSTILSVSPLSGEARPLYGAAPGQELHSVIRGKHDWTPSGGLFITEFETGRVLEVNASGEIVWEYVNRHDADHVAEIGEARLYPAGYFDVHNWDCAT